MLMRRGGDNPINLMYFVIADHISDRRIEAHNLEDRNRMSIHIRDKLLGNNSLQYHGQLDGNLSLLGWFEYIYDTTDRVCCSGGVKTGENEMSCLGSSHGSLNRLVITHFTKENHIRALAQGSTQGNQITFRIGADFSLADDAFVMPVHVLKRIFQRNDMSFTRAMPPVNV